MKPTTIRTAQTLHFGSYLADKGTRPEPCSCPACRALGTTEGAARVSAGNEFATAKNAPLAPCALCPGTFPAADMIEFGFRLICLACHRVNLEEDTQREREQAWAEEEGRELADLHAGRGVWGGGR